MCEPGAARSGRRDSVPTLAQSGTTKPLSMASTPATAITNGLLAGEFRLPDSTPSFPAAVTTTMPADHARSTAASRAWASCVSTSPASSAMFRTRISRSLALATTQSMPEITLSSETLPSRSATLIETIPASGATPRKPEDPLPAMMPARCVPCPFASRNEVPSSNCSELKSTAATIWFESASTGATPVSINATLIPAPVIPCCHSERAPI